MTAFDLDPVDRITADAVGEPGERTFFIQAAKGADVVTLLVEKQQVAALARLIEQLLERVTEQHGPVTEAPEDAPSLTEPLEPAFRVGQIGVGYDADRDLVLLQCDEFVPEDEEEVVDPAIARLWASREQMLGLAERGSAAVEGGRPTCSMCGKPIEPDGHFCPPSNGQKKIDSIP